MPFIMAELGAGYGRLGYVMLKTTACRYVVFDISPALYLSQWYLTTLFPDRRAFRFRRFDKFKEIEHELSQADIAFFTPNQLAKFPSAYFDAFATISSFHEMQRNQINHYTTLMARTTRSTLYSKQQRDYVNPVDDLIIGKDDYPLPRGWSLRRDRIDLINPGFFEQVYRRTTPIQLHEPSVHERACPECGAVIVLSEVQPRLGAFDLYLYQCPVCFEKYPVTLPAKARS
jgi:predicted RNA-binding Zn-ribbon protein involved in translation (DUF1610 family)